MRGFRKSPVRSCRGSAFKDLLSVIVILTVLLSFADTGIRALIGQTRESRLQADVNALNHSIYLFRASGGDLSDALTPEQVISKMQAVEQDPMTLTVQSVLITGLKPIHQTPAEAKREADRAFWNADSQVFEIYDAGRGGIKAFQSSDGF